MKYPSDLEPKYSCPLIDEALKNAKEISYLSGDNSQEWTESEMQSNLKDINYDVDSLASILEDIRDLASELRAWGTEWKEYCEYISEDE